MRWEQYWDIFESGSFESHRGFRASALKWRQRRGPWGSESLAKTRKGGTKGRCKTSLRSNHARFWVQKG